MGASGQRAADLGSQAGAATVGTEALAWAEQACGAVQNLRARTLVYRQLLQQEAWVQLAESVNGAEEAAAWEALASLMKGAPELPREREQLVAELQQLRSEREELQAALQAAHARTLAAILALQRSRHSLDRHLRSSLETLVDRIG